MVERVDSEDEDDGGDCQMAEDEVEATFREVRAFMDDPVALLERAVFLLRRAKAGIAAAAGVAVVGTLWDWADDRLPMVIAAIVPG
ncbi:MAG TPA: hypothetical protein VI172_03950 [Candidatus Dormibacteraeota bacterium]|jgi:hypothetical protein